MLQRRELLTQARSYLRNHPDELTRMVRSALGLRLGIPLAALRYLVEQLGEAAQAMDLNVSAEPPALRVSATIDKMETRIRAGALVYIDRIQTGTDELRVELRIDDLELRVLSDKKTIVSALLKSGTLAVDDLGALLSELPKMPEFILKAHGNHLVVDLMRVPSLRRNPYLRHALGLSSGLLTVHGVQTDTDHLDIVLRAMPRGARAAARAVRAHFLRPGAKQVRALLAGEPVFAMARGQA